MSERAKAMRRIVAVQDQMKRLAEWKLQAGQQDLRATEAAQNDLTAFIEGAQAVGPLGVPALRQLQRLAERQKTLEAERDRRAEAHREAQRRLKSAETMADTLARIDRETAERRALETIIEAAAARARNDPEWPR